jgi:hypothetical protein
MALRGISPANLASMGMWLSASYQVRNVFLVPPTEIAGYIIGKTRAASGGIIEKTRTVY